MTSWLQLAFGTFLLSLIASYLVWTRFRIVQIRQELFTVRDRLWEEAYALDAFNDPAYRDTRSHLNSMIRGAHRISLSVILHILLNTNSGDSRRPASVRPEVQDAIDRAINDAAESLLKYVIYGRPFSGLLPVIAWGTMQSAHEAISRFLKGSGPTHLEAAMC